MPGVNELVTDGAGNCISGSLVLKDAASLTFMWPRTGGGTEGIKLMSGNGRRGGRLAGTLCGGADMTGTGAMTPARLDAGRTALNCPPFLGCRTPVGRLEGGRLFGSNGKCVGGMPGGNTDGGGKLTSTFGAKLPCVGP